MISSIQLSVGREYVPSWVFLAVLARFVLVQLQYLLLKHFRVIGMGLAFFMLISLCLPIKRDRNDRDLVGPSSTGEKMSTSFLFRRTVCGLL